MRLSLFGAEDNFFLNYFWSYMLHFFSLPYFMNLRVLNPIDLREGAVESWERFLRGERDGNGGKTGGDVF